MEAVAIYLGYLVRKTQTISCFGIENVVFLIYSKRPDFVEYVITKNHLAVDGEIILQTGDPRNPHSVKY